VIVSKTMGLGVTKVVDSENIPVNPANFTAAICLDSGGTVTPNTTKKTPEPAARIMTSAKDFE